MKNRYKLTALILVAALFAVLVLHAAAAEIEIAPVLTPLADTPASHVLMPSADGKTAYTGSSVTIDASNTGDGYIMIKYDGDQSKGLKVIITGPSGNKYTYDLSNKGNYDVYPFSDGNGEYKIATYKNTTGNKYTALFNQNVTVKLKDEFAPFLRPNQYVNYKADSKVVSVAADLTKSSGTELEKVEAVYKYVISNFTYDKEKAATVQSGYLPDVDQILSSKKGICFDYAAVMASMLRSQAVPTKLVVGYTGDIYHAWLNVYTKESGWVEGAIFFDGTVWKLMDPTFASTGNQSDSVMQYIGKGDNYSAKYLY